jgi:hypothetical protein
MLESLGRFLFLRRRWVLAGAELRWRSRKAWNMRFTPLTLCQPRILWLIGALVVPISETMTTPEATAEVTKQGVRPDR